MVVSCVFCVSPLSFSQVEFRVFFSCPYVHLLCWSANLLDGVLFLCFFLLDFPIVFSTLFHIQMFLSVCRAAGVILAGLCVPQFARQYIKATREKDAKTDSKEKRDASEGAEREKQLRAAIAALATQKKSDFRRHIVETLLFADPTRRLTATAAYARTQQLLKACVVKYNEKYDDIAAQRHTIWSRLQALFAKITSRSPLCFVLLRVTPAKDNQTNFQFRVVLPLDDDSDAEKQVRACPCPLPCV